MYLFGFSSPHDDQHEFATSTAQLRKSMTHLSHADTLYLPVERFGTVEAYIMSRRPSLIGPIKMEDDFGDSAISRSILFIIRTCVASLTANFGDKPFHFCISGSNAVNAVIADLGPFRCMIIGEELYFRIINVVLWLARSSTLTDFVMAGRKPIRGQSWSAGTRAQAMATILNTQAYTSDSQVAVIERVLTLISYFLVAHEIGHVALGHLESRLMTDRMAAEVKAGGEEVESPGEKRALEWDADGFAAVATVWFANSSPSWPELAKLYPDTKSAMRSFMVAACTIFSTFDAFEDKKVIPVERTHPAPMVRLSLMVAALAQFCVQYQTEVDAEEVWQTSMDANLAVEIALHEAGGGGLTMEEATTLQGEAEHALDEVGSTLQRLKPTLNRTRLQNYFWAKGF